MQVFNKRLIVYFSSIISIRVCLYTIYEEAVIGLYYLNLKDKIEK